MAPVVGSLTGSQSVPWLAATSPRSSEVERGWGGGKEKRLRFAITVAWQSDPRASSTASSLHLNQPMKRVLAKSQHQHPSARARPQSTDVFQVPHPRGRTVEEYAIGRDPPCRGLLDLATVLPTLAPRKGWRRTCGRSEKTSALSPDPPIGSVPMTHEQATCPTGTMDLLKANVSAGGHLSSASLSHACRWY